MIVVATTVDELGAVVERLRSCGVRLDDVVSVGGARRVVCGSSTDPGGDASLAASLRAEGLLAVAAPDDGPAADAWHRATAPVVFADRLSVCPAWSRHDRGALPGLIELGPGGFGNGRHPTTAHMIEELVARIAGGESVLDVGCGSGVLGLCALRLGAARVVATDIDPDAVAATERNAGLDCYAAHLEATRMPLGEIEGSFDVVLANIGRAGIVALARDLVARLAAGGWIAVSGFSPSQTEQVAGFLRLLREVGRRTTGDWAIVVLTAAPTR